MKKLLKRKYKSYPLRTLKKKDVTPTPKIKRIYTRNSMEIRQFLSRILHELYNGLLDERVAGRLAYISNINLAAMKEGDYEKRLKALEDTISQLMKERAKGNAWQQGKADSKNSKQPLIH